jgi:hypothetical protein
MHDLFVGADLADRATRALTHSARPDAPVVAPTVASPGPRARVAAALHRLASALEPAEGRDRRVGARVEPGSAC